MLYVRNVFITSLGCFFPGNPVSNEEMEDYLGRIHGNPSRARARVLKQNGIQFRHYAIDKNQRSLYRNSEMAALAVKDALDKGRVAPERIRFLAAATTQGDLAVPGFASMVHGELPIPTCEIASLHGVCASGMMALKSAFHAVRSGEHDSAIACASEFPSRLFKASRFQRTADGEGALPFDTEFLRWMLSDGAGAAHLSSAPSERGLSLRLEWIDIRSHAHENEVCMYAGANKGPDGEMGPSWLDYPSVEMAAREGAVDLKQDIRLLDRVVKTGVDGFFQLIESGRVDPDELDWIVCHYSSNFFKEKIFDLLRKGGLSLPEEKWFTNLHTRGNVGCASLYVQLEELFNGGKLKAGERIFLMVPESGRFAMSYALATVVGEPARDAVRLPAPAPAAPPVLRTEGDPLREKLVRRLARVWFDFEGRLRRTPTLERLERGAFTLDDYSAFLVNIRQQVVEGARWIARAASNIDLEAFPLRSLFLRHAQDEHRDFTMLERDYVSVGGTLEEIQRAPKNVGSEALSAWMFHRAGQPNPFDLLGAMFIIEGLGSQLARRWGELIRDRLGLRDEQVSFLLYHGSNDDSHLGKLEAALGSGILTGELVERIVKTAKVTARLYALQLEEIGNV